MVPALAAAAYDRNLTVGDSGADVTSLQTYLIADGYSIPAGATGYFGAQTQAALAAYQSANGINPPAGYFGPLTRASLSGTGGGNRSTTPTVSIPSSSFTRNLTVGDTGPDVVALQQFLNTHGFPLAATGPGSPGNETDYFGVETQVALAAYQSAHGIYPLAGYFGSLSRASIVATQTSTPAVGIVPRITGTVPGKPVPTGMNTATSTSTTNTISISAVSTTTTNTSATIAWTTDASAGSVVDYGTTGSYGSVATVAGLGTTHSVTLNNLIPGSIYHYEIVSAGTGGSGTLTGTVSPGDPTNDFTPANSFAVASGCSIPTVPGAGTTYYVDANNGSDTADGSEAHPWATFSHAVSSVSSGDTIYLMTGSYTSPTIAKVNSSFITVAAAPGQHPIISSIELRGAQKWIFEGITFESAGTGNLVLIDDYGTGTTTDIVLDHDKIESTEDASAWSQSDWRTEAKAGINIDGAASGRSTCVTVTNSLVRNTAIAATLGMNDSDFKNNVINYFGDDALDYNANNLDIENNFITNAINLANGVHADAMQGQAGRLDTSSSTEGFSNVTINANTILRQTDPAVTYPDYMQGIDDFDMNWTNLSVTNNVVVTNSYQGLSFASVHTGLIANNTLLSDGDTESITNGATSQTAATPVWLDVNSATHQGTPSDNVVIRNNIADAIFNNLSAATFDHNMAANELQFFVSGATTTYGVAGSYADNNYIDPTLYNGFLNFATTSTAVTGYDFHLLASSPAAGVGTTTSAPASDIEGTPRVAPIALGAYTSTYAQTLIASTSPTYEEYVGVPINFSADATGGVTPLTYAWNFGDASTSSSQNPSHTYSATGTYTATVTVTDARSNTSTATATVTIVNVPTYDTASQSIFDSWTNNGCTVTTANKINVNNWVVAAKADNTFSKLVGAYFLEASHSCTTKNADALTNWVNPTSLAVASGSMLCTSTYCSGNSRGALDTGIYPSAVNAAGMYINGGSLSKYELGTGAFYMRLGANYAYTYLNTRSGATFSTSTGLTDSAPFPGGFGALWDTNTNTLVGAQTDGYIATSSVLTPTTPGTQSLYLLGAGGNVYAHGAADTSFGFFATSTTAADIVNILKDAYNYLSAVGAS